MKNVCRLYLDNDDTGWGYCPSIPAAILFAVLFGLTSLVHMFQWHTFRKKFCWVIVMAALWETAGFTFRIISAHKIIGLWHFIPQQLFVVLAPVWLNAFVFMVMGRMIYFFIPEKKIYGVSAKRITVIFVALDVFSMIVQASSSSFMTSDDRDLVKIGINVCKHYDVFSVSEIHPILTLLAPPSVRVHANAVLNTDMGGIGLQELFIILFFVMAGRFQYLMTQLEIHQPQHLPWRRHLYSLYAALVLITIRIIFRLVEYSSGTESGLAISEAAFYCLEAVPMFTGLVLFNVLHPGHILVGPESEFPKKAKKSKKDREAGMDGQRQSWKRLGLRGKDIESGDDSRSGGVADAGSG
ncbi:RTA1 domain-containing protein [Paracoccidioides lutzii Pb01]|uniref:RTA1 domain-containing protein n=1 Tax=Paracoccidioides lutzii (strain ATCC MYA-826 / Pb01) TaxID=502779 RepID=C1GU11_PARBA|nr:RTA1 domain-containing protein [Paracoccidioides lutzii Pb01]EEH39817.1 RTA1 domain-containing protein [Paracoccidioides lutzii Pb01]